MPVFLPNNILKGRKHSRKRTTEPNKTACGCVELCSTNNSLVLVCNVGNCHTS